MVATDIFVHGAFRCCPVGNPEYRAFLHVIRARWRGQRTPFMQLSQRPLVCPWMKPFVWRGTTTQQTAGTKHSCSNTRFLLQLTVSLLIASNVRLHKLHFPHAHTPVDLSASITTARFGSKNAPLCCLSEPGTRGIQFNQPLPDSLPRGMKDARSEFLLPSIVQASRRCCVADAGLALSPLLLRIIDSIDSCTSATFHRLRMTSFLPTAHTLFP